LIVVFGLLVVGGYVAFGRTVLPDLWIVYVTGAVLGLLIAIGLVAIYALGPKIARFFPSEVRRIGRLFREGVLHSFRALPFAGAVAVLDRAVSVFSVIVVGAIVYARSDRSERVGG